MKQIKQPIGSTNMHDDYSDTKSELESKLFYKGLTVRDGTASTNNLITFRNTRSGQYRLYLWFVVLHTELVFFT